MSAYMDPTVCSLPAADGRLCALPIYHPGERHAYYDPPRGVCGERVCHTGQTHHFIEGVCSPTLRASAETDAEEQK